MRIPLNAAGLLYAILAATAFQVASADSGEGLAQYPVHEPPGLYRLQVEEVGLVPEATVVSGHVGRCSGANCYWIVPGATISIAAPISLRSVSWISGPCKGRNTCAFVAEGNELARVRGVPFPATARRSILLWARTIFFDGFENATTDAWSETAP